MKTNYKGLKKCIIILMFAISISSWIGVMNVEAQCGANTHGSAKGNGSSEDEACTRAGLKALINAYQQVSGVDRQHCEVINCHILSTDCSASSNYPKNTGYTSSEVDAQCETVIKCSGISYSSAPVCSTDVSASAACYLAQATAETQHPPCPDAACPNHHFHGAVFSSFDQDQTVHTFTCCFLGYTYCTHNPRLADVEIDESIIGITNLSPNPSSGLLEFNYTSLNDNGIELTVYDVMGRVMSKKTEVAIKGDNSFHLDLSELSEGIYFLEVKNGSTTNSIKFSIEK